MNQIAKIAAIIALCAQRRTILSGTGKLWQDESTFTDKHKGPSGANALDPQK
jgi:hypothetical protein